LRLKITVVSAQFEIKILKFVILIKKLATFSSASTFPHLQVFLQCKIQINISSFGTQGPHILKDYDKIFTKIRNKSMEELMITFRNNKKKTQRMKLNWHFSEENKAR
jgi:hypothetical protein